MKNWTIKEAVEVINNNTDTDSIKEIAKHFPMFFAAVARGDLAALAAMMPDKFTVRRLTIEDTSADADDAETGDTEDTGEELDLTAMSTKELMKLCDKRGIKVPHYGKNKQFYIDALNNAGGDEGEDAGDEGDGEDAADEYEGKSAMELFKLCKKRNIKAAPKKPAKFYADLLRKADAENDDATDEGEDDWGDEGEDAAEEKPAAKSKGAKGGKGNAKGGTKANKPAKDDADDDEWDI